MKPSPTPLAGTILALVLSCAPWARAETASYFKAYDRDVLEYLTKSVSMDSGGAMGRNKDGYMAVAYQRAAFTLVFSGVAAGDAALVERGMKGLRFAFAQQRADGGFKVGAPGAKKVDELSAASFFLGAAGMSYKLIRESPYAERHAGDLRALRSGIERGMGWLYDNRQALLDYDRHAANRLVFDALAFKIGGDILETARYQETGERFLNSALAMQRSDGVFPEKDGHDSSYQAVTLLMLQYYWLFGTPQRTGDALYNAIARGAAWEKGRILPGGEVSSEGNTRTGRGQESVMGKAKDINYPEVVQALMLWGAISRSPDYRAEAMKVFGHMSGGGRAREGSVPGVDIEELERKNEEALRLVRECPRLPRGVASRARRAHKRAMRLYKERRFEEAGRTLDQLIEDLRSAGAEIR